MRYQAPASTLFSVSVRRGWPIEHRAWPQHGRRWPASGPHHGRLACDNRDAVLLIFVSHLHSPSLLLRIA